MILATSAAVWMPASYGWPVEGPQEEVQFANWLRGLREEALEAGISEATVEVALSGITPVKVAPIARTALKTLISSTLMLFSNPFCPFSHGRRIRPQGVVLARSSLVPSEARTLRQESFDQNLTAPQWGSEAASPTTDSVKRERLMSPQRHQDSEAIAPPWLSAAVLTLTGVAPSHAQQPAGKARTFISINGGLQALTGSFSESVDFPESGGVYREVLSAAAAQEQARFESDYRYRTGALFDVSGGVRIAPYFALGAGISWFNTEETASVSAQLPHPLYFNRTRSISGISSPLTRSEMAVHLQAYVVVPATNSLTVMGFAGPTFFNVKQQLVTDVNFVHTYPFDTATFSSAVASRESASAIGFNVGADVTYYFTDHVGIGWFTRYSRATLKLPSAGNGTLDIKPGGLHAAGGLRLRF